jgi:hypothetical protein
MWRLVQQWRAIVQAVSAAIVAFLTYRLVRATDLYARIMGQALGLSREQFEHELLPNWHISFEPAEAGVAWLSIFNLKRTHLIILCHDTSQQTARSWK